MVDEKRFDHYRELVHRASTTRVPELLAVELIGAVSNLLVDVATIQQDLDAVASGEFDPEVVKEVVRLRRELETMTEREKRWREEALRLGALRARESVSAFSDFCEGHKAGMKQAKQLG